MSIIIQFLEERFNSSRFPKQCYVYICYVYSMDLFFCHHALQCVLVLLPMVSSLRLTWLKALIHYAVMLSRSLEISRWPWSSRLIHFSPTCVLRWDSHVYLLAAAISNMDRKHCVLVVFICNSGVEWCRVTTDRWLTQSKRNMCDLRNGVCWDILFLAHCILFLCLHHVWRFSYRLKEGGLFSMELWTPTCRSHAE